MPTTTLTARLHTLCGLGGLLFVLPVQPMLAQEGGGRMVYSSWREYGWVDFGGALVPDLDGRFELRTGSGPVSSDVQLEFSPGFSVNGGLGERFSSWLAAEIQGGFLYHNLDETKGAGGLMQSPDAALMQVPVFFNLVFEVPLKGRLTPFLGAGAGAMISWLDIDDRLAVGTANEVYVDDSTTEVNFCYQAFAGGRLRMGQQGVVELTYRFFGGGSPNWSLKENGTGDKVAKLKADDVVVHALTLGFLVEF